MQNLFYQQPKPKIFGVEPHLKKAVSVPSMMPYFHNGVANDSNTT